MTVRIDPKRYWKRLTLNAPGPRHEDDAERDPDVRDERERLVAGRPGATAEELDRDRPDEGEGERRGDGRHVEQVAGGDPRERDVPDAVADQRLPALDEEEPDGRGEEPDDDADPEGEAHELELEHQWW